ncbi:MAG TPA: helix-turn-helix transcriptional regulator, partial [Spirochaetota bacterium]|nr:helix-turn-helix transcriptional regulator [Spirochaetota bacterium]
TGYKINDYINKLRIEDAAAKLAERDGKIIEIAFSVGFESLTTFNRVFKSVVGKTPTEYREMA